MVFLESTNIADYYYVKNQGFGSKFIYKNTNISLDGENILYNKYIHITNTQYIFIVLLFLFDRKIQ